MGDGNSGAWIDTLGKALALGPAVVAPGHGPAGDGRVLEAQRQYFVALRAEVQKRRTLSADRVQAEVPAIRDALLPRHATYIDAQAKSISGFESQVAQVYRELTGKEFPKRAALEEARRAHEHHHEIRASQ
jgi:glyoxylase-like metal-dependent hydrolase (beta-lactamase superfamily II)